jgi:DNA-binding transcriptional MerR regulator
MKKKIKGHDKLITITELSLQLGFINKRTKKPSNSILRFWEKKFKIINPVKLSGNRRYYSEDQVNKIKLVKFLLRDKGLTIEGAKKVLKNKLNKLDDYSDNSITNEYYKKTLKLKTLKLLDKIKNINNG